MIKGILFDMDGLMLDTEKLLCRFWREAASHYGFEMTREHVLGIRSLHYKLAEPKLKGIFGDGFDYAKVRSKRIELMNAYIAENGIETKKGLTELLRHIKRLGLKCAVCTATDLNRTTMYLTRVGVMGYFDGIVCGDMIENGKPAPDIYLLGAKKLSLRPEECIALEDSPNGIESAYRAGCLPVMIPDLSQPDKELAAKCYRVCENLLGVIDAIDAANKQTDCAKTE